MSQPVRSIVAALVVVAAHAAPAPLAAQTSPSPSAGRARVLQIVREDVKPGKAAAHEAHEAGWPRAFRKAGVPLYYVGMAANTGPGEAWYVIPFQSLTDMAEQQRKIDENATLAAEFARLYAGEGEYLSGLRTVIATLRDDLSHGALLPQNDRRVVRVTTYRVRPGMAPDFARHRSIIRDAMARSGTGAPFGVYQVSAGMPGPSFMVFEARRTLAAFDDTTGLGAYRAALGDARRDSLARIAKEAFVAIETNYFTVSPRMSNVPPEVVAADPSFWRPRAVAAKPELARRKPADRP